MCDPRTSRTAESARPENSALHGSIPMARLAALIDLGMSPYSNIITGYAKIIPGGPAVQDVA